MRICRPQAFSLMELLLVLVVMSVIAGLAVPNLFRFQKGIILKTTVRDCVNRMRLAQSRAVTHNRICRLIFEEAFTSYRLLDQDVTNHSDEVFERIKGRVGRAQEVPNSLSVTSEHTHFDFYPDGRVDKGSLSICRKEVCQTISTREIRGRIMVYDTQQG